MQQKRFHGKSGEEYELFKLACPHYDNLQSKLSKFIKQHFKNSKQSKIRALEIGCGPGYTTVHIISSDDRIIITAVDNEQVMINQAKVCLEYYIQKGRVKLVQKDALDYLRQVQSKSFDVFASGFTLHNFEKKYRNQILKEIYRVLKQGGLFINADKYARDNVKEHNRDLKWQLTQFEKTYVPVGRADLVEEWSKHYLEDNNLEVMMKEKDTINEMRDLGYIQIKTIFRKHMEAIIKATK